MRILRFSVNFSKFSLNCRVSKRKKTSIIRPLLLVVVHTI
jgi:hypothetical protein